MIIKMFIGLIYFNKRDFLPTKIFLSKAIEIESELKTEDIESILNEFEKVLNELVVQ